MLHLGVLLCFCFAFKCIYRTGSAASDCCVHIYSCFNFEVFPSTVNITWIIWIYGNKDTTWCIQLECCLLKYNFNGMLGFSTLNCEHLLCNDRQNVRCNAIKIIKNDPGSSLNQSLEEKKNTNRKPQKKRNKTRCKLIHFFQFNARHIYDKKSVKLVPLRRTKNKVIWNL